MRWPFINVMIISGISVSSKHENFLVVDKDGNFQLQGYDNAVAAKKSREPVSEFDELFGKRNLET